MKKITYILLYLFWLCNLYSQNWVSVIDSMPNSRPFVYSADIDTVNNILYIGGDIQHINNIQTNGVFKYDGVNFDSLGAGIDPQWKGLFTSQVKHIKMFQNKLYVAGQFKRAGKYYSPNLARWNGSDWDTTNFTLWNTTNNYEGVISAFDVYNNELYVAGYFDSIGGMKCNNFAKFDGTNWHSLSYPFYTCVSAVANYKGKLYMAGGVTSSSACTNLAYYDGVNWNPWYGVSGNLYKSIFGMKVIDSMLFVYGRFKSIGGTNCNGLAAWNGNKWYGYGSGVKEEGTIFDLSKVNGDLYITGVFDSINDLSTSNGGNYLTNIAKFDLTTNKWCTFLPPIGGGVNFSIEYNNELYFGGAYLSINDSTTKAFPLSKWIGGSTSVNCGAFVDVGINEYTDVSQLGIYPNPTTGILNIKDEFNLLQDATIEIKDYLGQIVFTSTFSNQIDISNLATGLYFLSIKYEYAEKTVKFIKE